MSLSELQYAQSAYKARLALHLMQHDAFFDFQQKRMSDAL